MPPVITQTVTTTKSDCVQADQSQTTTRPFSFDVNNKQYLPNGQIVDWNKGLLGQLEKMDSAYLEWLEHPRLGRCRLFDDNFRESLSFTPWWTPAAMYLPWAMLEIRKAYVDDGVYNVLYLAATVFLGILMWSLFEYVCHRFAFHWEPKNPKYYIMHFLGHGLHHITPTDQWRLVFPPAISFPLGVMFRSFFYLVFPAGYSALLYAGFLIGYVSYESMHFFSHHMPWGWYLKARSQYHAQHHFNKSKKGKLYGVSSQLWDHVFGTL